MIWRKWKYISLETCEWMKENVKKKCWKRNDFRSYATHIYVLYMAGSVLYALVFMQSFKQNFSTTFWLCWCAMLWCRKLWSRLTFFFISLALLLTGWLFLFTFFIFFCFVVNIWIFFFEISSYLFCFRLNNMYMHYLILNWVEYPPGK